MNVLIPENVEAFLTRFDSLNDGVVRQLEAVFSYIAQPYTTVTVVVSVQDRDIEPNKGLNKGWVNLCLTAKHVKELQVYDTCEVTYTVLSGGVHIGFFDRLVFLDFGARADAPRNAQEIRESKFYVAGECVQWEITPYTE